MSQSGLQCLGSSNIVPSYLLFKYHLIVAFIHGFSPSFTPQVYSAEAVFIDLDANRVHIEAYEGEWANFT